MSGAALIFFLLLLAVALQLYATARASHVRPIVEGLETPTRPARTKAEPAPVVEAADRHGPAAARPAYVARETMPRPTRSPSLRQAVVMMEILGPPRALRDPFGSRRA